MKTFLILFSLLLTTASFAQANVRCTLASSDMSPDSFFYIQSDDVGSVVNVNNVDYRVISSVACYHNDLFMQLVTLQNLPNRENASLDIVCF